MKRKYKKAMCCFVAILLCITFLPTISTAYAIGDEAESTPVESVDFDTESITVKLGDEFSVVVSITPENATNKGLLFNSSEPSIVAVNDFGNCIALSVGEATITVASSENNEICDSLSVIVEDANSPVGNESFSITYVLNGGTNNEINPVSYDANTDVITLAEPIRPGYFFSGWFLDESFEQQITTIEDMSGDLVLYAKWEPYEYTIKFDSNGGTGTMPALSGCKYDVAYALTENAFKRTGYAFCGWNTKKDGSGTNYSDKTSVKNLTATNEGTVILYAKWTPYAYTIKFNANGGSGTMSALTGRKYGTAYTLTANAFNRTGYAFDGWNTKSDGSGTSYANKDSVKNLTATNNGTVTLYAKWKPNTYTIKFNANGGTGTMSALTGRKYGTAYTLTANAFKRTGYKFAGWNTKADKSGSNYANKASVKNLTTKNGGTITLYAKWTPNTYTIKFSANGGTGTMSALTSRKYGTAYTLTANAFKRTGYTFNGWNTKAGGSGINYANKASVKNLTATNNGTVTLYAKWKPNTYTIKFNANGGTGTMSALTNRKYGASYTLTANAFKRTNYSFLGWTINKNGSGTLYKNKASIKNLTATNKGTVTLYAQWGKTTELNNAIKTAKNYLSFMAFSKEGLINQLKYEKYPANIAKIAVDRVGANWNSQALKCAKEYLNYSAFSKSGLKKQLIFEKFTDAQATYAVNNCGANWNTQAKKTAASYLRYSSYSHARLVDQLIYEGFTKAQAEYGVKANGL